MNAIERQLQKLLGPSLPKRVGLALSGGVDSTSLAVVASHYLHRHNSKLYAFTVNHHLRPESTREALQVARNISGLPLEHQIISLDWSDQGKPTTPKLESTARYARKSALHRACNEFKISHLLLGHTQNDQIETYLMRLASGSSSYGLACSMPSTIHKSFEGPFSPPITEIRPLLSVEKAELYALCKENNIHWVEDPSNHDISLTERNRLRNNIAQNIFPPGESRESILQKIEKYQDTRTKDVQLATRLFHACQPEIDEHLGKAVFTIPLNQCTNYILLSKLIERVVPRTDLSYHMSKLKAVGTQLQDGQSQFTALDLLWVSKKSNDSLRVTVSRARIRRFQDISMTINGHWNLFDERYWMRTKSGETMYAQLLHDIESISSDSFKKLLSSAKTAQGVTYSALYGIPLVTAPHDDDYYRFPSLALSQSDDVEIILK